MDYFDIGNRREANENISSVPPSFYPNENQIMDENNAQSSEETEKKQESQTFMAQTQIYQQTVSGDFQVDPDSGSAVVSD